MNGRRAFTLVLATSIALAGCGDGALVAPPALRVNTSALLIPGVGAGNAQSIAVSESGYGHQFSQQNTCGGSNPIASLSATSGAGPTWNVVVTGLSVGTCIARFSDVSEQVRTVSIIVLASGYGVTVQAGGRAGE